MEKVKFFLLIAIAILLINCEKKDSSPSCEFSKPLDGDIFLPGEIISVSIKTSDEEGALKEVKLYVDNYLVYSFDSPPYEIDLDTWGSDIGDYTFKAVAIDQSGQETSHIINFSFQKGLIYNNILYDLDFGLLDYFGQASASSYNFDVTLLSGSFLSTNTGNAIYLELFSEYSTDLGPGTYEYDGASSFTAYTFDYSDFILDYNIDTDIGISGELTSGFALVEKNADTYKLFVNGSTSAANQVLAYYEGFLQYSDQTGIKKSEYKKGAANFGIKSQNTIKH